MALDTTALFPYSPVNPLGSDAGETAMKNPGLTIPKAGPFTKAAVAGDTPPPNPQLTVEPIDIGSILKKAAPGVGAGLGAAQAQGPSSTSESAVANTLESGLSGALPGLETGNIPEALAGGGIGLAAGGLNAWLSYKAENDKKAKEDKLIQESQDRQRAKERQARTDSVGQTLAQRNQLAMQQSWGLAMDAHTRINDLINGDEALKAKYLQTGILNANDE